MANRRVKLNPWERQPSESEVAYAAFRAYLNLPPGSRSYLEAYRQAKGKPTASQTSGVWNGWISKYAWAERARAYDNDLYAREREAEIKAQAAERAKWARRRAQVADDGWELAEALKKKIRDMLSFPLFEQQTTREQQTADGRTIIQEVTIKPAGWRMRDAAFMLNIADRLQRLAAEMATDRIETVDPLAQAEQRLDEARRVLAESRELFSDEPEAVRAQLVAEAFGVPIEDLLSGEVTTGAMIQ